MTVSTPIVALATAAGRGGIGVVRASGPDLGPLIAAVCGCSLRARQATYLSFLDGDGVPIDRGIAIHFPAPHSYTGEDVLELQGHGGPVVMQLLLARCLEAGAGIGLRLAEPGEFTQRAFLNDKLDLTQAEAVADLIEATTEAAARSASRSLAGAFSAEIDALVDRVIALRMLVEATLDFPEEEIDFLEKSDARGQLDGIRAQLDVVLATAKQGALLREGLHVVLAGEPNVGKSSLLNALAGAELAIVTPIAGTTRDRVAQTIQIEGIPLHVIDTAGLRETDDEVEKIGIARSWDAIAKADLVLHLVDAAQPQSGDGLSAQLRAALPAGVPVVTVCNKIDAAGVTPHVDDTTKVTRIWLSAKHHQGIDLLRGQLLKIAGWQGGTEGLYLARERHLVALRCARAHLTQAAEHASRSDQQLDLFAEELRLAQEQLSAITGAFTPDDLLGVIFSRFCIGK